MMGLVKLLRLLAMTEKLCDLQQVTESLNLFALLSRGTAISLPGILEVG